MCLISYGPSAGGLSALNPPSRSPAHPLLVQVRLRRLRIGTRLGAELERSKTKQANSGLKLCPRFLELKRYTLLQAIVLCGSCLPLPVADMLKGSTVPSPFPCFFTYLLFHLLLGLQIQHKSPALNYALSAALHFILLSLANFENRSLKTGSHNGLATGGSPELAVLYRGA